MRGAAGIAAQKEPVKQMERVKKKEKRKQIKKGWILALALVILGLVTGLLLHEKKEAAKVPEEVKILQAPQEIFVVNLPEMDVDSLAVYPRDYTDYELMRINGEMKLRTDPDTALRQDVVEDILYAAGCMKADIAIGKMDEVPDPPEAFGFDEPLLRYVIRQVNGTETQVLLGDKVPGTDAELYYCTADGMLYTVLAEPCEPLFVHEEYLRDFRLRVGNALLTGTDRSIAELSACCGFENQNYFSRCYKQYYGETPSQSRARNLKNRLDG